eukprot:2742421-Pyramimonas_sp.AAC.1
MAKATYLHQAGITNAIFAIQEVHQTLAEFQFVMSRIAPSSSVVGSFEAARDGHRRGGVATVVPLAQGVDVVADPLGLIPGRVLRLVLRRGHVELRHYNVHNHGPERSDVLQVTQRIQEDYAWAAAAPSTRMVVVCGDFNFSTHEALDLSDPTQARDLRVTNNARTHMKLWLSALPPFVE